MLFERKGDGYENNKLYLGNWYGSRSEFSSPWYHAPFVAFIMMVTQIMIRYCVIASAFRNYRQETTVRFSLDVCHFFIDVLD